MQPEAERERNDQQKNKGRGKEVCFPSSFFGFCGGDGDVAAFFIVWGEKGREGN